MKIFVCLFAFLIPAGLLAQTTRVTTEDRDRNIKEQYYVLKSDKQTKNGKYEVRSLYSNKLLCEGYYKNNLKDSIWRYYSFDGKVAEHGNYKNDKKTGMWYASNYKGELQVQYDFTESKLIFFKKQDTVTKRAVISGTDTLQAVLERNPIYLDGEVRFTMAMLGIRYPARAKENNVQGIVIIAITVGSDGNVSNYRVKKGIGSGCDEEALKMARRVEGDWLPGLLNGKVVTAEYDFPVSFTLANE